MSLLDFRSSNKTVSIDPLCYSENLNMASEIKVDRDEIVWI